MSKFLKIAAFFFALSFSFLSASEKKTILPDNIIDITIDAGCGVYVGDFLRHLIRDGAYIATPALDLYLSFNIIRYFGIQAMFGSGSIIHPYSYPIEGTILYMGLEAFGQYEWKRVLLKLFAGAGYQHTTMLIQWYASGFFEAGFLFGIKITEWMYLSNSFKYRTGFLHSVIIMYKYGLPANDALMSITFSAGITFRIKNPYLNK